MEGQGSSWRIFKIVLIYFTYRAVNVTFIHFVIYCFVFFPNKDCVVIKPDVKLWLDAAMSRKNTKILFIC